MPIHERNVLSRAGGCAQYIHQYRLNTSASLCILTKE
jgi:hypothetical protein